MRAVKVLVVSVAIIACTLALAWTFLVPRVIDHEVRAHLRAAGFAHAAFSVGDVTLDRVELLDVTLADGLQLGDVAIEAGPLALWRGQAADVVLRGPRIGARMSLGGARQRKPLPFRKIVIEDGELSTQDQRIAVRGTIDLRGTVALEAAAPALVVGGKPVTDVAATVRGPLGDLQICATGTVAAIQLDACGHLVDLRFVERATIEATGTYQHGGLAIRRATAHLDVTGDLDARSFTARGELAAAELASETVTFTRVRLPFAIAGTETALRSEQPLVVSTTRADLTALGRTLRIGGPTITIGGTTTIGPLALAAGPSPDAIQLLARFQGVPLDPVLRMASRDRVRGTGLLDGELAFAIEDGELGLAGGALAARAPGRLTAPSLAPASADALHQRIGSALADFLYAHLTLRVATPSELRLSLEGRGRRVPQALAIDVNVRGLFSPREEKR